MLPITKTAVLEPFLHDIPSEALSETSRYLHSDY